MIHMISRVLVILLLFSASLNAQVNFNMTMLSNVQYAEGCNDIWGYTDANGIEYAILGTRAATAIISLEDPANPVEIAYIPGSNSTWRDMKTWGKYAYVTCDAGSDGLLIINLGDLPNNVTWSYWKPELTVNSTTALLERCHNLYIDENGFAYLSGCNPLNNGGVLIFDVNSNPELPTLVGHVEPVYSHDNFTRGDTVYSANLNQGFYITDVVDKENHITLATQKTSLNFTHNIWLSDDGNYVFTTDERANAFVDAYDISNHNNIFMTDRYQPIDTRGTGVIPHNTHYFNGYNVISWYTDGVKVIDSHKPDNLVEVANYDTYLGSQVGFQGCWGAYPFLPSGRVLASDINTCLWVFDIEYKRAAYLEGTVIDAITKAPIQGASVVIEGGQPNEKISGPAGDFKTGSNQEGNLTVRAERTGYFPKETTYVLSSGQVTNVIIELTPLQKTTYSGLVIDSETGDPVSNATVRYLAAADPSIEFRAISDLAGNYLFDSIFLGEYQVIAGAWGYTYTIIDAAFLSGPGTATIELDKGYRDDFIFDYGWSVSGTAPVGQWELGKPEGTLSGNLAVNPASDLIDDLGADCYVTGLLAGNSVGEFDLDGGNTVLLSPEMNLSDYENPVIRYHYWFVNAGGNGQPNDTLQVYLLDGTEEMLIYYYTGSNSSWISDSIIVKDYFSDPTTVRMRFSSEDKEESGHLVECGIDGFLVEDVKGPSSVAEIQQTSKFLLTPNPFASTFQVQCKEMIAAHETIYSVVDTYGKPLESGTLNAHQSLGQAWTSGIYFITLRNGSTSETHKVIKVVN